jgi:prepilin-type N-terminal cleavage/methylation domain-containing protein
MKGGKNRQPLGYTIIEVMIVLAVSGVMFLIAASFINGKQEHASFTEGVNQMASNIQDIIEQVTDGQYSDIGLTCTSPDLNAPMPTVSVNSSAISNQGGNHDCVFIGKLLHFYISGGTTYPENYEVFSLVAARTATGPDNATSGSVLTSQAAVPQSLEVRKMTVSGATTNNIGFVQSQGNQTNLINGSTNGSQTVKLVNTSGLSSATADPANLGTINTATSALICLSDGTQYAAIDVGDNNDSQLSANVAMYGTTVGPACS